MAPCFVYYGSGFFHSGFDLRVTVIQMVGCGDFLASSGLWWNLRCALHARNRSASLCDAFQSFSSHHLSASSEVRGISSYPQRRSLVGDLVQWMQILASSGMSSAPSGGQSVIAICCVLALLAGCSPEDHESDEVIFSTQVVCISGQSFALAWIPASIGNFQMEPLGKACQQ